MTKNNISTVICPDIEKIRYFYENLLGLKEKSNKNKKYAIFQMGDTEVMFCEASDGQLLASPSHSQNKICAWSIPIPEALYLGLLYQLKQAGQTFLTQKPEWRNNRYWGVTVSDPVGNHIELYTTPSQPPPRTDWEFLSFSTQ